MIPDLLLLVAGLTLLVGGGEVLMRGALSAAKALRISPLLSGLVIVGFGTSMPELTVSLQAAMSAEPDIAIGNVVGSNIANILLILGLCALITPMLVQPQSLRRDGTVMVAATLAFVLLGGDGRVSAVDGAVLFALLLGYMIWAYTSERYFNAPEAGLHNAEAEEVAVIPRSALWTTVAIFAGLGLLIGGSQLLLKGAVGIAHYFEVSEALIGLTIVAVGTSLPELSISLIAALRRHADVAVGNVLGSNIFNALGILGISAMTQPLPLHGRILQFDQWVMLATAIVLILFMYTGRRISRGEGALFLAGYIAYIAIGLTRFSS